METMFIIIYNENHARVYNSNKKISSIFDFEKAIEELDAEDKISINEVVKEYIKSNSEIKFKVFSQQFLNI